MEKHITAAECFIDTDPGEGNGIPLQAEDGTFDEATEEAEKIIYTGGMSVGRHTLYVRMRDSAGNWGPKRGVIFRVGTSEELAGKYIVAAEYFVDSDPGEGNGTPLQAKDGAFDEPIEEVESNFNISGIPPGKHTLYVRMKDSEGKWGPKKGATFEAGPVAAIHIAAAEYFIDNDPGEGNGTPLQTKDGAFDGSTEEVEATFNTSELSPGEHALYVRMKDSRDKWGVARAQTFTVLETEIAKGDVNGDGETDILDIVKIVAYITEQDTLSGKEFASADVAPFDPQGQPKGDGKVNILDIVGIVDMILHPEEHRGSAKIALTKPTYPSPATVQLSEVKPGFFSLDLNSEVSISGLQIKLSYDPERAEAQEVLTTKCSNGMALSWNAGQGKLIALLYSPDGERIAPGNNPVLQLHFSEDITTFSLEEVVLSDPSANPVPVFMKVKPGDYALFQNYPNPTNAGTSIRYALAEEEKVRLEVYNTMGQLVRVLVNEIEGPGYKTVFWDGKDKEGREVSSGVYLYRLKAGKFEAVKKLVILK